jgi:hypothetical protein
MSFCTLWNFNGKKIENKMEKMGENGKKIAYPCVPAIPQGCPNERKFNEYYHLANAQLCCGVLLVFGLAGHSQLGEEHT